MKMTERERFEAWAAEQGFNVKEKSLGGLYIYSNTSDAFLGWKAARATPALPEGMALVPVELLERVEKFAAEAAEHYSRMSDEVCQSYSDPWLEGVTVCKELRAIIEDKP